LDKVVARAGEIDITLSDFNDAWNKITPQYRPTSHARAQVANDLVNQYPPAEARRLGGITDPKVIQLLDRRSATTP
jgi:hypothetical protein